MGCLSSVGSVTTRRRGSRKAAYNNENKLENSFYVAAKSEFYKYTWI